MTRINRRVFLQQSAATAGRAVAGLAALNAFAACGPRSVYAMPTRPEAGPGNGYGPLRPAGRDLALPEGFSYRLISPEGSTLSDGYPTPGFHDGMAAFSLPNGNIRLIRNHEVPNTPRAGAAVGDLAVAYDEGAGGGTTSLEIDPETREMVRHFISLSGTWRNCAGGPTPWGSWLSCEEAFFGPESGFGALHGYIFEVPVAREQCERTEPLVAMGRLVHEAVAVDPATGIIYETEDQPQAGLYRFLPNQPYINGEGGDLRAGGVLQMLAVRGRTKYDTRRGQRAGRTLPVAWVDIGNPDPQGGPEEVRAVFEQGYARGGALFARLEGAWYGDGNIYIVSTSGGNAELGQVWQYHPVGPDGGELMLVFESPRRSVLNRPDNICVSPRGALILCEDANDRRQYVRGLTRDGQVFDLAANIANDSEFAGATFSPDGRTLFFNILRPGKTFAVWGPWERGAV